MKKRFVFRFSPDIVNQPIVTHLVKEHNVSVNILNADLSSGREGKLVVELEGSEQDLTQGVEFIRSLGVVCSPVIKELRFKQESCVSCGSCTAVCFSGALQMDPKSWELLFDPEKCVVCGLCVSACPLRLFEIAREEV